MKNLICLLSLFCIFSIQAAGQKDFHLICDNGWTIFFKKKEAIYVKIDQTYYFKLNTFHWHDTYEGDETDVDVLGLNETIVIPSLFVLGKFTKNNFYEAYLKTEEHYDYYAAQDSLFNCKQRNSIESL